MTNSIMQSRSVSIRSNSISKKGKSIKLAGTPIRLRNKRLNENDDSSKNLKNGDLKTHVFINIIQAYLSNNKVSSADVASIICDIHLAVFGNRRFQRIPSQPIRTDRAKIAASLGQDYLTSFVDGKRYKSLKRHLTAWGLTPDMYRKRYGLPSNYPMVSPGYAQVRSRIAKQIHHGAARV